MELKQFRHEGCNSYIVADPASGRALIIDPHLDLVGDYREHLVGLRCKPDLIVDTHTHADHFSASHVLARESECPIAMGARTRSLRPSRRLHRGDRIAVGSLEFTILETPGHTPDSICIYGCGVVFTGDTLFIGSSGRTDFDEGDPNEEWKSLLELKSLPDSTVVAPGHDYDGILFSTIEVEKLKNPHLRMSSMEGFIRFKLAERIVTESDEVRLRLEFNRAGNPAPVQGSAAGSVTSCGVPGHSRGGRVTSISVEKYSDQLKLSAGIAYVDVRERGEYREGHIPGTTNIPLSEIAFHLPEFLRAKRVYLSCLSGRRSMLAAETLAYLGVSDPVNVAGGFKAWAGASLPVEK